MWFFKQKVQQREIKNRGIMLGMNTMPGMGNNYTAYATEGYMQNPVAFACISKIANAIASVDLDAYKENKAGKLEKLTNHPLEQLIESPNNAQSGRSFLRELVTQYLIGGNVFVFGQGMDYLKEKTAPQSLSVLLPSDISIKIDDNGIKSYIYKPNQQTVYIYPVAKTSGHSAILHIKTPNPINSLYGLPPMSAAAYGVDILNSGLKWNKKLLDNDCRPSGTLTMEGSLTEEQFFRLKEQIEQQYQGSFNAGKPLLLEGGLKWEQLSTNPKDMDFQENILTAARFIASVFHVPPQLINIPGESTYSNYEQAELSFWADTVLPLLGLILDDVNRWLSKIYDGVYLWYDEETITALEPMRRIKSDRLNAASYLSINEKRYPMNKEAINGGDEVLIDSGKIPLGLVNDMGLSEPGANG